MGRVEWRAFSKSDLKMKKLFILFVTVVLAASCGGNHSGREKTQEDAQKEFSATLSQSDTTDMLGAADDFIRKVTAGQIDEAVEMLYVLYDNQLYGTSDSYSAELKNRFAMLAGTAAELDYYSFSTQGNNDACYRFRFGEGPDAASMRITLNPVRIDGKWYLTLKDGSQSSAVMAPDKKVHPLAPAPEEITLHAE